MYTSQHVNECSARFYMTGFYTIAFQTLKFGHHAFKFYTYSTMYLLDNWGTLIQCIHGPSPEL